MRVSVSVHDGRPWAGVGGWVEGRGATAGCASDLQKDSGEGGLLKGTQHIQCSDGIPVTAVELLLVATS